LGIAGAYSLDRLLDASVPPQSTVTRLSLEVCLILSVSGGAVVLFHMSLQQNARIILLAVAVLSYRRWKKIPFAKALGVPLVWVWAGVVLPFPDGSWFGLRTLLHPEVIPLFLLLTSGCLLCDLKDLDRDAKDGVASLPVLIGNQRTLAIASGLAVGAAFCACFCHRYGLAVSGLGLLVLSWLPRYTAQDALGPLLIDLVLSLPGFLILARLV